MSSMMQLDAREAVDNDTATEGVGRLNFLHGKSYFITGATGLLAKGIHIGIHISRVS